MKKLLRLSYLTPSEKRNTQFLFYCPGCNCAHIIPTECSFKGPIWNFDGNMESPTFTPSLRTFYTHPNSKEKITTCHLTITNGKIQYCADSPHALAGQTISMVPIPKGYGIPKGFK